MAADITRGLCKPCWRRPEIRCQYPMAHNRRKASETTPEDISEEALDALIASQLPTMPGCNRGENERLLGTLPRAVSFGRGIDSSRFRAKPRKGNW